MRNTHRADSQKHHYQELPAPLKARLGEVPEGFLAYFTSRFPRLLVHVHAMVMRRYGTTMWTICSPHPSPSSGLHREAPFRVYCEPEPSA